MNAPFDQETGEVKPDSLPPPPMASFRMSGEMGPLFKAKAMARADFLPIVKDQPVEVWKDGKKLYDFVYADLGAVIAATERGLATNGLDLMWFLSDAPEGKTLRCILAHESGAFIESSITIPPGERPQDLGSALTYARRYQAQCVLGVAPEHDDDGGAAAGLDTIPKPERKAARPEPRREAPAPKPLPEARPAPAVAQAPAQAALPVAPVSAPPGPISPQVTKPVAGEPLEEELKKALSAHFVALGMKAATEKATTCKIVTGVSPAELTQATAEKLLGYLKIQAAERGVTVAA